MLWYGPPVLGQAHTPRRRLVAFAAFALAVLCVPAVGGARASHRIDRLRARDTAIAARSRSAVLDLYSLDRRLATAHATLETLDTEGASLRAERAVLHLELRVALRSSARAERALAVRVRRLYEQGDVGPIEVLFGSASLDDAMTSLDDLAHASAQDKQVLAELKLARARTARAQAALARRVAALAAARRAEAATALALARTRASRAAYLRSLAAERRLTRNAIVALVARAHAAAVRVQAAARVVPPAGATTTTMTSVTRTLTVTATGYALAGRTSTGLPVGWGVAAVDPSVIPLGTHLTVPGYGEAVAADTGGGITGATIDLWFPTVSQANVWGRRTVTIVLH